MSGERVLGANAGVLRLGELHERDVAGTCSAHPSGGEDTAGRRAHDDRTASVAGEQYVSLLADEPRNEMS